MIAALLMVVALGADDSVPPRLGIGVAVGLPGDGSGIPIASDGSSHLPTTLLGRWRFDDHLGLSFGFGTPIAGEGFSGWLGADLSWPLYASPAGALNWRVYVSPGAQLGFVGDGYYATHSHVFVGWEYIYSGPVTPSLRLPVGTAVVFLRGRLELFVEALGVLSFLPTPNGTLGGALGARVYVW
jgi:hypothetical protein